MKKTMSVGDLLNEIAKGTQPKKVKITSNDVVQTCVWSKPFRKYKCCDKPMTMAISELAANALVEYEAPVLDEVEKKYLSAVIKPFRHRVKSIYKYKIGRGNKRESLCIQMTGYDSFDLPTFPKETMYKGMESNREYTPDDLGI